MTRTYTGKTTDAGSLILGASFWSKGMKIEGTVTRNFETANGTCYEIHLNKPVQINGENARIVSVGNLKGFQMALNAAGLETLENGDKIVLGCVGTTSTGKGNPRIDFQLAVSRG
jgi:hypothetical protein